MSGMGQDQIIFHVGFCALPNIFLKGIRRSSQRLRRKAPVVLFQKLRGKISGNQRDGQSGFGKKALNRLDSQWCGQTCRLMANAMTSHKCCRLVTDCDQFLISQVVATSPTQSQVVSLGHTRRSVLAMNLIVTDVTRVS